MGSDVYCKCPAPLIRFKKNISLGNVMKTAQILVLVVGFVGLIGLPSSAQDNLSDSESAKSLFEKGRRSFNDGQFTQAADYFREANSLKPNWKLLYNIAQSEAAAKRHGLALTAFEQYLALGGDDIEMTRQSEVVEEIVRLKKMVGYVSVEAPDGATVYVDGVSRAVAPVAGGLPIAGSVVHTVAVVLENGETLSEKKVSLVSGNRIQLSFTATDDEADGADVVQTESDLITTVDPVQDTAPATTLNDVPADRQPGASLRLVGGITTGVGAALLVGAVISWKKAVSTDDEIKEKCPNGCLEPEHYLIDRRDREATSTTVLLGVGGGVLATGVVLLISGIVKKRKSARESTPIVFVVPALNAQGAGAGLEVRF